MALSQINYANTILNPLYSYDNQGVVDFRGISHQRILGIAKLTDTLQTAIPIYVPSGKKDQSKYPDKLLVVPNGAQVNYLGFRLPGYYYQTPEAYGYLPTGVTIVGTTGEKVKVSPTATTTYTQLSPAITAASSAYTPDATATAYRGIGVADAASPSILRTLGTDTTLAVNVSNAGDTAVGTGIKLSTTGAVAHIVVEVYYSYAKTPSYFDEILAGGDIYRNTFS
jgi:hypothetical protein